MKTYALADFEEALRDGEVTLEKASGVRGTAGYFIGLVTGTDDRLIKVTWL